MSFVWFTRASWLYGPPLMCECIFAPTHALYKVHIHVYTQIIYILYMRVYMYVSCAYACVYVYVVCIPSIGCVSLADPEVSHLLFRKWGGLNITFTSWCIVCVCMCVCVYVCVCVCVCVCLYFYKLV
jgi:hypothetical protein